MLTTILLAIAASAAQDAAPQQDSVGRPVLQIIAHLDKGTGQLGTNGGNSGEEFEGYVSTGQSFCDIAAGGREPQRAPAAGWRYSGRIVQVNGDAFTVQIEWTRLGPSSTQPGAGGGRQATLRLGERLTLDRVPAPSPNHQCGVIAIQLEAAIVTPAFPRTTTTQSGSIGSGSGVQTRAAAGPAFVAEFWLVHKVPDGREVVQRQTVKFGVQRAPFFFSAVPIGSGRSRMVIEVRGSVGLGPPAKGVERLLLAIERLLDGKELSTTSSASGGTVKMFPTPQPTEVISFELPPFSVTDAEGKAEFHALSLRLRVTVVR